ncbi:MAG TPA: acyl-CoA dehydrogenase [Bacteroidetes bacterium]|nr:acyl-CoA dehydrogenase [Bacteroidota bacterium]
MNFQYTEEQQMVRKTIRDFALTELAPTAAERDEKAEFPTEAIRKLGELGFWGVNVPEEQGGAGLDMISYCITVEELGRVDASAAIVISIHNSLAVYPVELFGNDDQKERFLKPMAQGRLLGAYALTEPEAGSDAGSIKTRAVRDGDHYVLNGSKIFTSAGESCDLLLVFVATDPEKGSKGLSAIIVEKGTPGLIIGKHERKLGIRSCETVAISFEDCRVPAANLIGEEGMGFKIAMNALNSGRIGVASQALGIAQACLDESVKYSKERVQFGRPISKFQAIQFKIARMGTEIEAARMLLYSAAGRKDRGEKFIKEAAMAKLYCSELAVRSALEAVQIHGGYGYIKEYPVERFLRDAKITTIYEGTNEIMHLVIADQILGR